jgi:hypothetical protein
VTSAAILDGTIVTADLADSSVTSAKILDATIVAADLASEAWTAYTPTSTNITIGNGTIAGRWIRVGRTIHCAAYFGYGSTSSISGRPAIGLPVAGQGSGVSPYGCGRLLDGGVREYAITCRYADADNSKVMFLCITAPGTGVVDGTNVFAIGVGDYIEFAMTYEAAS